MKKFISILLLALSFGCSQSEEIKKTGVPFYDNTAGWDIIHIPFIPPFKATSTYPKVWLLNSNGKKGFENVEIYSAGVTKPYVYGQMAYNGEMKQIWFLANAETLEYEKFNNEIRFIETLKEKSIQKKDIYSCNYYNKKIARGKWCYWYPSKQE